MPTATEILSLVAVAALWGTTNPFLRRGSSLSQSRRDEHEADKSASSSCRSFVQSLLSSIYKFRYVNVWLPYLLNQAGSLLYYFSLSKSDLSLVVPICNALALMFSFATSFVLGERVDQPIRAMLGSTLVIAGVGLCLLSQLDIMTFSRGSSGDLEHDLLKNSTDEL